MRTKKQSTDNFRSTLAQILATLSFSLLSFNIGVIFGMPTIVIGALRKQDSSIYLSETQASWFGSLLYFTQPLASLASGVFQEVLGRKRSLMMVNIPKLVSWMILYFATSVEHLFLSVALMGISIGFLEAPIHSYIGEVTQPRLRGVLCSLSGIFSNLGLMVVSFLGAWLSWRSMVLCCAAGPVMAFVAMSLMPDSPAWLVTKGRVSDAEKAYQWLRGWVPPDAVKEELNALVEYVRQTQLVKEYSEVPMKEDEIVTVKSTRWRHVLVEPEVLTAMWIIFICFILSTCASLFAVRPFFIEVLENLNTPIKPHIIVAICGFLQMAGSLGMGLIVRALGKRGITFLSLILCVFCCMGLGIYFLLGSNQPWIPVALFCLSYFSSSLGIAPLPWILIIELFPLRARGPAGSLCAASAYVIMFLVTKTYYTLASFVGVSGTCLFYGVIGLVGLVYLYYNLPETEGHTLEDIERRFSEKRRQSSFKKFVKKGTKNGDLVFEEIRKDNTK